MKGFHFKNGNFDPTMARSVHFFELAYARTAKNALWDTPLAKLGAPKFP